LAVARLGEVQPSDAAERFIGPDGAPHPFPRDRFSHF
jgi:hypothetical protein